MKKTAFILSFVVTATLLATARNALAQTWVGTTSDFGTASNWSPATVPSGTDITFGVASGGTYAVDLGASNRDGGNVLFSNANTTNAYTLSATPTTTILRIGSGKTLTVESTSLAHTVDRISAAGNVNYGVDIQGASTNFEITENFNAQRNFTKDGAGKLTISGSASIAQGSGTLTINGGTIDLIGGSFGNGNTSQSFTTLTSTAGTLLTNSGTTQRLVQFGSPSSTATASGNITGNLRYLQGRNGNNATNGTQILAGTNTYTGDTLVFNGTLLVNGSHNGGDSYQVRGTLTSTTSPAILGGTGTIVLADNTKTFSIGDGAAGSSGILYPGGDNADTGVLTLGSGSIATAVNFNTDGILRIDIGASTNSDRVDIFGSINFTLGGALEINALVGAWNGSTYTIATFTGTRTGTFASVSSNIASNGYQVNYLANSITLSAIPEPSTFAMLLGGLGLLVLIRRRRALA